MARIGRFYAFFSNILATIRSLLKPRAAMAAEIIAMRHQICVLLRQKKRSRLRPLDRILWVWLSRFWKGWRNALVIVQPDTVVGWHRRAWRLYWRWKSRVRTGRPQIAREIRDMIRRIATDNPLWGAPRIHAELLMLGFVVSEATVARYMPKRPRPASSTWRTFLQNQSLAACDFFTVPTLTFGILYVFVILRHSDRRMIHIGVTENPTDQWTSGHILGAFPWEEAPKYLLRDNDKIYGEKSQNMIRSLDMEDVRTAFRSPWQNAYVERVIGSIRRECTDHIIPLNRSHLARILRNYRTYYNESRCHLSLGKDAPEPREIEPPERGEEIIAIPQVGGLHNRYTRRSA